MKSSNSPGPRRSELVNSYRWETRAIAAVALLALVGGVVSYALAPHFWGHHALLTGLASSVIVVMLSVALISEALERRGRRRWRVLAQHVMIELVSNARLVWTTVMELGGLMPPDADTTASIDAGAWRYATLRAWPGRCASWSRTVTGAGCFTRRSPTS